MSKLFSRRALPWIAVALAVCLPLLAAESATFAVDSTADHEDLLPGDGVCRAFIGIDKDGRPSYRCTLRAAVQETNALDGADVITLAGETYTLTRPNESGDEDEARTGDLDVYGALEILGVPAETVIDAGGFERAFFVCGNLFPRDEPKEVRVFGVEIRNGSTPDANGGGALWNVGAHVLLDTVTLRANRGSAGGALLNQAGRMSLVFSTVSENEASIGGGAVSFGEGAEFYATETTFSGNASVWAHVSYGGGGAIALDGGTASLLDVTIHDNEAVVRGGGLRVQEGVVATIRNVLIAGNRAGESPDAHVEEYGFLVSDGGNLIGDGTGSGLVPGVDQVGSSAAPIDPRLGPLADNGGYNGTHLPFADSPAVDRANTSMCSPFDQRFEPRPFDGDGDGFAVCDVGAVEYVPEPAASGIASLLGLAWLAGRAPRCRRVTRSRRRRISCSTRQSLRRIGGESA